MTYPSQHLRTVDQMVRELRQELAELPIAYLLDQEQQTRQQTRHAIKLCKQMASVLQKSLRAEPL